MITRNRTIAVTAAAAVLGTAAGAPEALAAHTKVTGGRTSLTLTRKAAKEFKTQKVKVTSTAPGAAAPYGCPCEAGSSTSARTAGRSFSAARCA
jgi:hypothetical protein